MNTNFGPSLGKRILILDDEPEIGQILGSIFCKKGYEVSSFTSLNDASNAIDKDHYALALLDIQLGEGMGYDLIPKLRTKHPHIPIISISAYANESETNNALKMGANIFVAKPFTSTHITELADRLIFTSLEK